MTGFQKDRLKIILFCQFPLELLIFFSVLIPIALVYLTAYLILGDLKSMTEADLPALTIHFPEGWMDLGLDNLGLEYSLSGWWNILFLAAWLNLMRYLYKMIYRFKFPYSGLDYSAYSLLLMLSAVMIYFSVVGGAPFYGLVYSIISLAAYTLTHGLVCLLIWFLGAEKKS